MTADQPQKFEQKDEPIPEFTLHRKYIDLIKSGKKTVEGRINSGGFKNFKVGDKVKFFDGKNPNFFVVCVITGIGKYATFREMLEREGVNKMIPEAESLNEAEGIYNRIPSYPERAKRNGVLALRIKVFETEAEGTIEENPNKEH